VFYDPVAKVAGMLHAMLPEIATNPQKAARNPSMFIESGIPYLLDLCVALGAQHGRIIVKAAGGAHVTANGLGGDYFKIGDRNVTALRRALWKAGLLMKGSDTGGATSRTMLVHVSTGEIVLSGEGAARKL
jgi:chemotaxis protein CheD